MLQDGRSSDLSPVFEQFTAQGRFLAVNAQGAPEDVLAQAKVPFQPHVVLLVGSAGSGRGEFARRCVVMHVSVCAASFLTVCVCDMHMCTLHCPVTVSVLIVAAYCLCGSQVDPFPVAACAVLAKRLASLVSV